MSDCRCGAERGWCAIDCFFGCGHVERWRDPELAHNMMEAHYGRKHAEELDEIVELL